MTDQNVMQEKQSTPKSAAIKAILDRQVVIFRLGEEEFGVDIGTVKEISKVEKITRVPNAPCSIIGIMNLRGRIISIIDLSIKLGMRPLSLTPSTRILIAEINGSQIGMLVDSAKEVQKISEKDIIPPPDIITRRIKSDCIEGVSSVGKKLVIFLNLGKVMELEEIASPEGIGNLGSREGAARELAWHERFFTRDGKQASTLEELAMAVGSMDDADFGHHLTPEKNDFAEWVEHCLDDAPLAEKIRRVKTQQELVALLSAHAA